MEKELNLYTFKLFGVILVLGLLGCKVKSNDVVNQENSKMLAVSKNKIIFVNYQIKKESDKPVQINLIRTTLADGNLKQSHFKKTQIEKDDLICYQLGEAQQPIDSMLITNPLVQRAEYVNDNGDFKSIRIDHDSINFTVRMQLKAKTKYIGLKAAESPGVYLSKFEL